MNRKLLILSAVLALAGLAAADAVQARGGGGGGGTRGKSAASRRARQQAKKDGKKKDVEAARERLRQMDYRDRDSSRDRGPL